MAVAGDSGLCRPFPAVFPGFSKGFAEPRFAPREGIEPPNVARFVVRLRGLLISFLPFRTLSSECLPEP